MANTLKFGNGEWYGKKDTILAYNDENNNYKPLPFDFSRGSSATVINKDGLIEEVGSGEPRVDYKDDTKGALLLEPQRSNLITQSERFDLWSGTSTTQTLSDEISPSGELNSYTMQGSISFASAYVQPTIVSGQNYTFSFWAKNATNNGQLSVRFLAGSNDCRYIFNINELSVTPYLSYTNGFVSSDITEYENGWYRCSITVLSNGTTSVLAIYPKFITLSEEHSVDLYGAQLEQGSYATSYIPTQGGVVTRLADECINGGNEQVFNDSQGGLYMEFEVIEKTSSSYYVVSVRSSNGSDVLGVGSRQGKAFAEMFDGTNYISNNSANLIDGKNKIVLTYNSGSSAKLFLNGVKVLDFIGTIPLLSNLSELVK